MSRVTTWARKLPLRSATQKLVLLVLADHADANTWQTIAGQDLIAAEAALSPRGVRGALSKLATAGVIHRERRHRRDGTRTSDRITLNRFWQPPAEAEAETDATGQADPTSQPASPAGSETCGHPDTDDPATDPTTGTSCRTYRQEMPGSNRTPGCPPENPFVTRDVTQTSRARPRRPDQRPRTRPPSRPPRAPRQPQPDPRLLAATQLLAAWDLDDRRRARLLRDIDPVRHQHAWHQAATARRLERDGPELARLAAAHPGANARQLTDLLEPPEPPPPDLSPWTTTTPNAVVIDLRPPPGQLAAEAAAWSALQRARQAQTA